MNKKTTVFAVLALGMSLFSFAQRPTNSVETDSIKVEQLEEVLVTDSKFNLKREHSGKVITKITQEELERLQGKTVAEIINSTVGIEINGTKSNAGQNLAYYVRGGRNRQVVVLIDGVALTDASQIANDYDLRLLNADQVESIEILKGASSTLYGSGAGTAVINIQMKKPSWDKISGNFQSVIGSNQSSDENAYGMEDFRNHVAINGSLKDFNFLASFGNQYTDGLSAVAAGSESDPYNAINGRLKLGYGFYDAFKMSTYASFDRFKADFDDGFSGLDADNRSITNQYRIGISPEFSYGKGSIILNAAYNHIEREIFSSFPAQFEAESFVGDLYNRYNFNDKFYTILGVNAQENSMESFSIPFGASDFEQSINPETAHFTIIDPYANVVYVSQFGLNVNAGARFNNHSEYGSHLVYSLNPSFRKSLDFGYIKGLASYSTAYITPSLYQLFEPTFGNDDLQPEENTTLEFGLELNVTQKALFSLVYFNRNEKNFIDFVDLGEFVFQYKNVSEEFTASGLEFTGRYDFSKKARLNTNFTYTKVEENLNLRIPKLKANTRLDYQPCDATVFSLSYQFNDERRDSVFNNETFMSEAISLKSYSLLDLYVSHSFNDNKLKLFANVTNILNENYIEISGFSTRGRNFNFGFNLTL